MFSFSEMHEQCWGCFPLALIPSSSYSFLFPGSLELIFLVLKTCVVAYLSYF